MSIDNEYFPINLVIALLRVLMRYARSTSVRWCSVRVEGILAISSARSSSDTTSAPNLNNVCFGLAHSSSDVGSPLIVGVLLVSSEPMETPEVVWDGMSALEVSAGAAGLVAAFANMLEDVFDEVAVSDDFEKMLLANMFPFVLGFSAAAREGTDFADFNEPSELDDAAIVEKRDGCAGDTDLFPTSTAAVDFNPCVGGPPNKLGKGVFPDGGAFRCANMLLEGVACEGSPENKLEVAAGCNAGAWLKFPKMLFTEVLFDAAGMFMLPKRLVVFPACNLGAGSWPNRVDGGGAGCTILSKRLLVGTGSAVVP